MAHAGDYLFCITWLPAATVFYHRWFEGTGFARCTPRVHEAFGVLATACSEKIGFFHRSSRRVVPLDSLVGSFMGAGDTPGQSVGQFADLMNDPTPWRGGKSSCHHV
jgi:hypothetical protein